MEYGFTASNVPAHFVRPVNATHLFIQAAKTLILPRSGIPLNSRNVMRNADLISLTVLKK
jgi:hypothetical protein